MTENDLFDSLNKMVLKDRKIKLECSAIMQELQSKVQLDSNNAEIGKKIEDDLSNSLNLLETELDHLMEECINLHEIALQNVAEARNMLKKSKQEIERLENKLRENNVVFEESTSKIQNSADD